MDNFDVEKYIKVPVIDIFAGPGGLGEGFASYTKDKYKPFNIKMSIEKDPYACRTLKMRSFFRKVHHDLLKPSLIKFLKSKRGNNDEEKLYNGFQDSLKMADEEVVCKELGNESFPPYEIDRLIKERLNDSKTWILIGGPPCQAYSTVGRSRMSRIRKTQLSFFESDERHYLYQHYLRIIASHSPPVFVMENVKGLLSSSIKGKLIIEQILKDLRSPGDNGLKYKLFPFVEPKSKNGNQFSSHGKGYEASDFLIKAEDFGIPQMRHRLIILGVRSDISEIPIYLEKTEKLKTVGEALHDLPPIRSGIGDKWDRTRSWGNHVREIKYLLSDELISDKLKNLMAVNIDQLGDRLPKGGAYLKYNPWRPKKFVKEWYRTPDLGGVANHEARYHMPADLRRYFFSACFGLVKEGEGQPESPKLRHFPVDLLPNHRNIDPKNINRAIFYDRFRVQLNSRPSTTITSHISKDGHYYIHPDPTQCRSLSVREAARLQTFPDSYIFLGSKTSQYTQVGNAVPPRLAIQLAEVVYDLIYRWRDKKAMVDNLSPENRSWNMSRIKGKDTKPEMVVRSLLHKLGYRFRLHRKDLPGIPDIVLPKYMTAIFVNGCFWHRHNECRLAYNPKTRINFWQKKFRDNVKRDQLNIKKLEELGWTVEIIWECEIKDVVELGNRIKSIFPR